ncbi:MAG: hypothetical protein P4M02_01900 [Clostridia bacterium]|nr:hypothetical protein [Clostridia bacterium]
MTDVHFYLPEEFCQKAPQEIIHNFKTMSKMEKDEQPLAVIGDNHITGGNNRVAILAGRLEYCYFRKLLPRFQTARYLDIYDIELRPFNGFDNVFVIYRDKTELRIDIPAPQPVAQQFFEFLKGCFAPYSAAAKNGDIAPAAVRCKSCGAVVKLGPGSPGICEYCGTRYRR